MQKFFFKVVAVIWIFDAGMLYAAKWKKSVCMAMLFMHAASEVQGEPLIDGEQQGDRRDLQIYQNSFLCPSGGIYSYNSAPVSFPICQYGQMAVCTCVPAYSSKVKGYCYISYAFMPNSVPSFPYYSPNYFPQPMGYYTCPNGCKNVWGGPYYYIGQCLSDAEVCASTPPAVLNCDATISDRSSPLYDFCTKAAGVGSICRLPMQFKAAAAGLSNSVYYSLVYAYGIFAAATDRCSPLLSTPEAAVARTALLSLQCDAYHPNCVVVRDQYSNPYGAANYAPCLQDCKNTQLAMANLMKACRGIAAHNSNCTCDEVTIGCGYPPGNETYPNDCQVPSNANSLSVADWQNVFMLLHFALAANYLL